MEAELRAALAQAADDLDKAANQFAGMKAAQEQGHAVMIASNPQVFAAKAERARAALAAHPPVWEELRKALRERAHCAYHEHNEQCRCRTVGCLTAFIADRLAEVVEAGPPYDGLCSGCRELGVGPWHDEGGEG